MNAVIKCRAEYDKIKDTPQDEPLVDVVLNNKNTVVYRKVSVERYTDFIDMFHESEAGVGEISMEVTCVSDK